MSKKDRSKYYVDENVVRVVAAQVVFIASISLWQGWTSFFILLGADFALRGFTPLPSPLALMAKAALRPLKTEPHPIFAPPKKFAAAIGFLLSLAIFILLYLNYYTAASIVGGVLIFFAFLESAFRICMGCRVYDWFIAPIADRKNAATIRLWS